MSGFSFAREAEKSKGLETLPGGGTGLCGGDVGRPR